jgi:hypothetical protein
VVLIVDRDSAYKAMAQVKLGNVVLVFCWVHVRRDLVTFGKGWPEHEERALAWLGRIRAPYRHDRRPRSAKTGSAELTASDIELRQTVAAMPRKPMPNWTTRNCRTLAARCWQEVTVRPNHPWRAW